jgi:hypothetical protein
MLQHKLHNYPQGGADAGLAENEIAGEEMVERRAFSRMPVIKSAKIICGAGVGQSVFNCLVLDETATGVLIDLGTLVPLPDEVTLQMGSGATYLARRRWGVGTKAGLEFIGGQIISGEMAQRMNEIAGMLIAQGVVAAVSMLRGARFFDHDELRRAAEEAQAAYHRLETLLTAS